ncbi:MAG: BcpO-related WXXGXW repeat protein, partial [Deltaproteobacteria bacterium]|nr:BcpO-related WXXGXW repeat protein [Deltaproteobacteria bacterium]
MKTLILIFFSLFLASGNLYGQAQLPPVPVDEQPEVQTRGPVNEAFAQPVTIEENTPFIVPKGPPADIDEDPPLDRPAGSEFAWIPGYWAWDSEKNTHIWISGCWRAVPPGKYWEPGYWAKVDGGYRWVPGFWANAGERGPEYLPQPPAVTYIDPPGADRPDMIWVPACWYWSNGRYILRKGYWIQARED